MDVEGRRSILAGSEDFQSCRQYIEVRLAVQDGQDIVGRVGVGIWCWGWASLGERRFVVILAAQVGGTDGRKQLVHGAALREGQVMLVMKTPWHVYKGQESQKMREARCER